MAAKLCLMARGGDETLLGYERYFPAYIASLPIFEKPRAFVDAFRNSKLLPHEVLSFLIYFRNPSVRFRILKRRYNLLKSKCFDLIDRTVIRQLASAYSNVQELQRLEITSTQLPHLLNYEDKNSMFHSVETRLPFLDYRVLETSLSINNKFKIRNGWSKYVLRKAGQKWLPDNILWRKNKFGFEAPKGIIFEGLKGQKNYTDTIKNSSILQKILKDPSRLPSTVINQDMKWKFFNIAKWEQIYNVHLLL